MLTQHCLIHLLLPQWLMTQTMRQIMKQKLSNIIQQAISRYMKAKMVVDPNTSNYSNFAGIESNWVFFSKSNADIGSWVVDTWASSHICSNESLFSFTFILATHSVVYLANGSKQNVIKIGSIILHPKIILTSVLYIPSFKYNLLSVTAIVTYSYHFLPTWLQDFVAIVTCNDILPSAIVSSELRFTGILFPYNHFIFTLIFNSLYLSCFANVYTAKEPTSYHQA